MHIQSQHLYTRTPKSIGPEPCGVCKNGFATPEKLIEHIQSMVCRSNGSTRADVEDGITNEQATRLRGRGNSACQDWRAIWRLIFPQDADDSIHEPSKSCLILHRLGRARRTLQSDNSFAVYIPVVEVEEVLSKLNFVEVASQCVASAAQDFGRDGTMSQELVSEAERKLASIIMTSIIDVTTSIRQEALVSPHISTRPPRRSRRGTAVARTSTGPSGGETTPRLPNRQKPHLLPKSPVIAQSDSLNLAPSPGSNWHQMQSTQGHTMQSTPVPRRPFENQVSTQQFMRPAHSTGALGCEGDIIPTDPTLPGESSYDNTRSFTGNPEQQGGLPNLNTSNIAASGNFLTAEVQVPTDPHSTPSTMSTVNPWSSGDINQGYESFTTDSFSPAGHSQEAETTSLPTEIHTQNQLSESVHSAQLHRPTTSPAMSPNVARTPHGWVPQGGGSTSQTYDNGSYLSDPALWRF